jgi:hypothetical protein
VLICTPLMLIPKPIIEYMFQKSDHEIHNERLSEHEKSGIQMQEIRPTTDGSQKRSQGDKARLIGNLNDDEISDESPTKMEFDMQQHLSLKAAHTLRASLEGKEPEDFLKLIAEGLG